jgi:uncharacterized protein YutE (UPF0331/DUF86 family)
LKGDTVLVDKLLLGRKLSELDLYLTQVREFATISVAAYQDDWRVQRIVERTLQMLIEVAIDIANHLIADEGMRMPTGYSDTFRVLRENNVVGHELAAKMEKMAKLRNIVVHQYEAVDSSLVVGILRNNLGDFESFREAIKVQLKAQG